MPIPINPRQSYSYVLKRERTLPSEKQTIFSLRPLTVEELAGLEDGAAIIDVNTGAMSTRGGTTVINTLRLGLVGWGNFNQSDGTPVPFPYTTVGSTKGRRQEVTSEGLSMLSPADRRELSNAITEGCVLTEDDRGN